MSAFLYPRKITVTRPRTEGVYGAVEYGGQSATNEDVIVRNIPCSIQMRGRGGQNPANLPGDAKQTSWRILVPLNAKGSELIQARDILTDDFGRRYQSADIYPTSLGIQLSCDLLET